MLTPVAKALTDAGHKHVPRALQLWYGLFAFHGCLLSYALPRKIRHILENHA